MNAHMLVLQVPLMTIKQLINIAALRHFMHTTTQKSVQLQGGEGAKPYGPTWLPNLYSWMPLETGSARCATEWMGPISDSHRNGNGNVDGNGNECGGTGNAIFTTAASQLQLLYRTPLLRQNDAGSGCKAELN